MKQRVVLVLFCFALFFGSFFFLNEINEIDKSFIKLTKKQREKIQMNKIRGKRVILQQMPRKSKAHMVIISKRVLQQID